MNSNVRQTKDLKTPGEIGTHYRLLCMTGPNKGIVYYLVGKRILVGRGNNCDIQILDSHTSREHAELSFIDGNFVITDLGAQNGIVINDTKIKQQVLSDGEKIVIGQSVFRFSVIVIKKSKELEIANIAPDTELAQEIFKGKKFKIDDLENRKATSTPTTDPKDSVKKETKSKKIIIAIFLVGLLFMLLEDNGPAKKIVASKTVDDKDMFRESVASLREQLDPDTQKKLDSLIHSGRREFREGNYFRAMEDFRLALILSPNNGQASFYLSKAKQKLDEDIRKNFEKGVQELDSKKYHSAIVSFCGVVQLIKEYPNDERYKNAWLKISTIESAMGLGKGEIKCFEEKSTN